jgi:excinuclease ABC subunit A
LDLKKQVRFFLNIMITLKGVSVHNLKHINVDIPRGKFVVITGVSGSGKSSLAFDTLYAEGQRRYVESLSSYARQFLGAMAKPEADLIKGIPPAIAIQQKVTTRNPRSTVGTSTEIYEYLKLLFARIGRTYSPISGVEVKKHTVQDILDCVQKWDEGTRLMVMCPIVVKEGRQLLEQLEVLRQAGYSRVEIRGSVMQIDDALKQKDLDIKDCYLIIDRLVVNSEAANISRLTDSVESAFFEGEKECIIAFFASDGTVVKEKFSSRFEADGIEFEEPSEMLFSFNNPLGACPVCEGFGKIIGIDEDLVVPNKALSIYEDAVVCWRGEVMREWKNDLIRVAEKVGFPIHRPYYKLTKEEKQLLWDGNEYVHGINEFFRFVENNQYKIQYRVLLSRYRGKTICPECNGTRLRTQANYVKVGGETITHLVSLSIKEVKRFFEQIQLSDTERETAKRLLIEINTRLQFLLDVGLGYLTLDRLSSTLSGGESQRINLATSLGSNLVGSLYILDEPSIGLHSRDTQRLIKVLRQLQSLGNTVVVVEHDEEIMRAADYVIDIGPLAGRNGGEIVWQGNCENITKDEAEKSQSLTLKYLTGIEQIEVPTLRRKTSNYVEIFGASENNLKGINVKFPLGVLTAVIGVSGSGKSSLVSRILYPALKKYYGGMAEKTGSFEKLGGSLHLLHDVEYVDQNPIGKSSRSNPVTYLKAYDEIRRLFAEQQLSKQMGFTAAHFSFNVEGGRCEECQGEGTVTVEMQFMADLVLECEACHGKRFKQEVLDVLYRGKNIYDVLEMTVNQAIDFFAEDKNQAICKKIVRRLKPLQDVGLGYIRLGQSSSTLSGGESQRVKLAAFLAEEKTDPMMFIFDEPTTGLHFHDIKTLMKAFDALIEKGHTVVVIEHNNEVIKCADYLIELGPDGGENGGNLIFEGINSSKKE